MNNHSVKIFVLAIVLLSFASCRNQQPRPAFFEGYRQTESGLYYKFHIQNFSNETIQIGDVVLAIVNFYWCDERVITDVMDISTTWVIDPPLFLGDLSEGFLMMQVGDSASFIIPADSVVKHWGVQPNYTQHLCDYFRVTIRIDSMYLAFVFDSVAHEEMMEEQRRAEKERLEAELKNTEDQQTIQQHIRQHNISVESSSDGVFVEVVRRGSSGKRARNGRVVVFNYTIRSLNGNILDSSDEDIAYDAGVAFPRRVYQPRELRVGEKQWLLGLDNAVVGQRVGSKLRLFMPTNAFSGQPQIGMISGFQPIILEIEILNVL